MSQAEWIYGIHSVAAILKTQPERVQGLYVLQGRQDERIQKLLDQAARNGSTITRVNRKELDKLTAGNHQGIVAEVSAGRSYDEDYLTELLASHRTNLLLLVLDGVTDPHNLGACIRTAEAAGCHAVVIPKDNSCGMNPTVRKVAAGAADHLPLIVVTNLSRCLKTLQQQGVWTVGTAGEAAHSLYQARLSTPMALVMGAEGSGMRRLTKETCDELISIPMQGATSSLNVSVATGVCLFEVLRQTQQ